MDRPEDQPENGNPDAASPVSGPASGEPSETPGRPGETVRDPNSFFSVDQKPTWKHGQKVTSDKARALLLLIKERMEGVIAAERAKLVQMTGARDSVTSRKTK